MAKKLPPEVQAIISAADAGLHATTVKLVRSYLESNPDSQRGWLDLGYALQNLSRFDQAEDAYRKALALGDDGPVDAIFGQLGNLARARGRLDEAAEWYQRQLEADPGDATGYLLMGNLELNRGNGERAIELLQAGLGCEKQVAEELHYSLGQAYLSVERYFDAKQQFTRALDIDPSFEAAKRALKDAKGAES